MSPKRATIKEVARACGMSVSTVGYILSDSDKYKFKEETRELVKATAKKLNYRPNPIASSFRRQKNNIIIGIVGHVCRQADVNHIKAMERCLRERGYNLVVQFLVDMSDKEKVDFFRQIYLWGAGLAIWDFGTTSPETRAELSAMLKKAPPTVGLFGQFDDSGINYTRPNWGQSYNLLADFFASRGCKSAAFCLPGEKVEQAAKTGIADYFKKLGISLQLASPEKEPEKYDFAAIGTELAQRFRKSGKIPDALYCHSDETAFTIIEDFRSHGIHTPEDVLIVGGGDSEFYKWYSPPLPVLTHDIDELVEAASDDLVERIKLGDRTCGASRCIKVIEQKIVQTEPCRPGDTIKHRILAEILN